MQILPLTIPDVRLITPEIHRDERGYFSESFNRETFREIQIDVEFVQDNISLSLVPGVLRGLHFQVSPFAQHKLIQVLRGRIFDVAVDIRRGSSTYGQHVEMELGPEEGHQIFVPIGFAHGFVTLEPETEVFYKVSSYYSPEHDRGIHWNDPRLEIEWPIDSKDVVVSEKDSRNPPLAEIDDYFTM
ncbi:MAG: dTDP-4-dehydrorhamnose 3,5-epimerase [Rhodospirillaceae bacterium]|jgi:dTDP-4-dehydrorhamnose 3,5-epimerase|nr:dTDP-4-dehydrorhamnose 3,5-epimerase [Rhodospirillaceae bacterium]|tara:strand:- start:2941 stop:3498 length:558 start_codon:yes stop_codon:yes gene_type:complete